jgi:hypothetical protein
VSGGTGVWLPAVAAALAALLALPHRARLPAPPAVLRPAAGPERGWMLRHRPLVVVLAGAGPAPWWAWPLP